MTRAFFAGISLLSLLLTLGCSGPTAPAVPPNVQPAQSIPVGLGANAQATIVPWSCLTASGAGIFALAVDQACSSRRATVVVVAAATAPGVPSNLTSSVSGGTVTLTWGAPTSADPATSYVIEAGSSAGSTNIAVFDTLTPSTSFTATGVPAGSYFVQVRARNSAGTSSASNEVVVIVGGSACTTAPGAPSGLSASVNGSTVTLTWTGPSGGCAPTGYVIEAGSSSGGTNLANFNTGSTATTFSAGGVPNGTYYVRARAANGNGQSAASNEITVVVGGPAVATLTGRWIGLVANGDGTSLTTSRCGTEKGDWQLDLTQNGSSVTGTLSQKTVVTEGRSGCSPAGEMNTAALTGTVSGSTFSFSIAPSRNATATFTATRMTGTTDFAGTFALNRQ